MTASAIGEKQILIVIVKVINNSRRRLIPPSNFKTTAPHRHLLIIINDFCCYCSLDGVWLAILSRREQKHSQRTWRTYYTALTDTYLPIG